MLSHEPDHPKEIREGNPSKISAGRSGANSRTPSRASERSRKSFASLPCAAGEKSKEVFGVDPLDHHRVGISPTSLHFAPLYALIRPPVNGG